MEQATLGGGCFWCLEAVFEQAVGVERVVSGYTGGHVENPTYRAVCNGTTGHAEVVQVTYDPSQITYADLLRIFFTIHDPTTMNRQGNDVGTQYRSAIYTHNDAQREAAESIIAEVDAAGIWEGTIVTEVTPLETFYVAEDKHQQYFQNNAYQPYCMFVVAPKVRKFREKFDHLLKAEAR
ncbi:MAG: peptide-methionine (S)-S-oxide reductase MsrA [Rhodothermales bacterium]